MHTFYRYQFKLGRIVITAVVGAFLALILTGIHTAAATSSTSYPCLLQNCSFETPTGKTAVPTYWHAQGLNKANIGTDASAFTDGAQSLWFADTGKIRKVYQDVTTRGSAGTTLTLSFWTKATETQKSGLYRVFVTLYYVTGGSTKFYVNAPYGTSDWTLYTLQFTARHDYKKMHVEIDFSKKGNAWFDEIQLTATTPGT